MAIAEVLQLADRLIFEKTGKHLDDLQQVVIQGVWQGKSYSQIGEECHRSESRVRDVGYRLWQILSEQLGEDINKNNFRSTIERLFINSSFINLFNHKNHHHIVNFCSPISEQPQQQPDIENKVEPKSCYEDLGIAPKINFFYGRNEELKIIYDWIFLQKARLISVLELSGIGQTTLVKRFVDLNSNFFDVLMWKSLRFPQPLNLLLTEIFKNFYLGNDSVSLNEQTCRKLFDLLRQKKCLIVLDDVQNIFTEKQLAGQYKPEYRDYKTFLKMMTDIEHQSCLILVSQEKFQEMKSLNEELYPIKILELTGLYETELLNHQDLENPESWSTLIKLYEGNALYLQNIADLIQDVFQGDVLSFVNGDELILTEDLKDIFNSLFDKLSKVEQKIIVEMSQQNQEFSIETLKEHLSLSSTDVINGLQSLSRRYILQTNPQNKKMFQLSPVFREYLKQGNNFHL
ncbi:NB-ARC domain-containing protein [Okeania sp. SIO2B3]|uniref:NB-ARC domain-containing protein n=1 Tax=Okeania sp. SIO2B3 TaxID=2607784 RepID=UPI0013C0355C|nr:NB-ARC domain-containing protein [Okeania sp. SIO2B3]NET46679.1 ATP-binding protein [Okeania sp. SIO2B3]